MRKTRHRGSDSDASLPQVKALEQTKPLDVVHAPTIAEQHGGKQTEAECDARYRAIVETASEGVWTIDSEQLITFVNPSLSKMLGYEPDEMLGKSVFDFMDSAEREGAQRRLDLRQEGISEQLEF